MAKASADQLAGESKRRPVVNSLEELGCEGDGYEVALEFDGTQVRRRRFRSLMVEEPSQETRYKLIPLQDTPRTGGRPVPRNP